MNTWILILTLVGGTGGSDGHTIHSIDFSTQTACLHAGAKWKDSVKEHQGASFLCVPRHLDDSIS
ncbi:hypothetical protein [Vibrio sp. 1180_3]|uniref:hypothetical protein n=1 Tax=Vibrio sp. 1180_3 TaxID=2528832 RepID=UPI0024061E63|nr:hypothetical protein [Vibrio sp. 1180_3]MDF9399211.1 hypothetical protein [Vibrio sp. 1180_3]